MYSDITIGKYQQVLGSKSDSPYDLFIPEVEVAEIRLVILRSLVNPKFEFCQVIGS